MGFLLLLVRDLFQDQVSIGWGKSRGFGAFELGLEMDGGQSFDSFAALLDYLKGTCGDHKPRAWVQSLHTRVQDQIRDRHKCAATGDQP